VFNRIGEAERKKEREKTQKKGMGGVGEGKDKIGGKVRELFSGQNH